MGREVRYISHGDLPDGGYRHEKFYAETLAKYFQLPYQELRKEKLFIGLANFKLVLWAFLKSNGKHNVVAARLGISSWIRNVFTNNYTYIVVHDYDKHRYNSFFLKYYYPFLFLALAKLKPKKVKMVVISPHWVNYFQLKKGISKENLILFYNFLDVNKVLKYKKEGKENTIHLGQYSKKNSDKVFEIAGKLTEMGYRCYFSTLDKEMARKEISFEIIYFENHEAYLEEMAGANFTLGFSRYHEGWNRVVHESALLNTPVIAFKMGGMKDLVKESHGYLVEGVQEALKIIESKPNYHCPESFTMKYDISKALSFLESQDV